MSIELTPGVFVLLLALVLFPLFAWAFRTFPKERWQILAAVPTVRSPTGRWLGVNFTFYGLLSATAFTLGFVVYCLLLASIEVSLPVTLGVAAIVSACGLPAARLVAWAVEGKKVNNTVSGGSFVALLVSPIAIWLAVWFFGSGGGLFASLLMPIMAALAVAGVLGEGCGRLACISFGCCYGRPLQDLPEPLRKIFRHIAVTFSGSTKKISYASQLEGVAVVPIQAITVVVSTLIGLTGILLFLEGRFATALLVAVIGSQVWRILSETLRADYRGGGGFTVYQQLGIVGMLFTAALAYGFPAVAPPVPDLQTGLVALWNPILILFAQILWTVVFVYLGRSMVTSSIISLHVTDH